MSSGAKRTHTLAIWNGWFILNVNSIRPGKTSCARTNFRLLVFLHQEKRQRTLFNLQRAALIRRKNSRRKSHTTNKNSGPGKELCPLQKGLQVHCFLFLAAAKLTA